MNNDRLKITITVNQRNFDIEIDKSVEYYYREAERIINKSFIEFAKQWTYTDHQDLLSKILIDFVVKWIENEERLNAFDENLIPKMERLKQLTETIETD
jgi:hypothetical protein